MLNHQPQEVTMIPLAIKTHKDEVDRNRNVNCINFL